MTKIIEFCKQKWFIQLVGVIALSLLIWFCGALVSVAGYVPLKSENVRWLIILLLLLGWGLNNLRIQRQQNRLDQQMVEDLSRKDTEENALLSQKTSEEIDQLQSHFQEALQLLKKTHGKTTTGQQYLYDLPWYMLIGPPGSGKTTALMNSGLEFPLADKLGKGAIRGVGGTRNCDWWFTDQAVLLDTAGRYTTQDSHAETDKAAWQGFLELLKKYRPRRPLNGLIITLSLSDLLNQPEAELISHAQAIRKRIDELYEQFGIRIPIYMLFTKGDLVAGFTDFFADLDKDERAQVWGMTFAAEDQDKSTHVLPQVAGEFDALLARLDTYLPKRLQEERDLQHRALIFGFPQRMALLKTSLLYFLQECYGLNRYQVAPYLRGIYFSSGTQEGTPIDRLMGILAQTFRVDRLKVPLFSGKGKSYFLTRLLKEVIFAEALLVGVNRRLERMQALLRYGTYALASVVTLIMTIVWFNSYQENQAMMSHLSEKIQQYEQVDSESPHANFSDLVDRMNAMQTVAGVYPEKAPWAMRFGLYQGEKLQTVSLDTYQQMLQKQFLPLIKSRLEQRLSGPEANNPELLYQLLKAYLMLGEPKRLEPGFLRPWLAIDWEKNNPADVADLLKHLDNLLSLPLEAQPLNENLVAASRQILQRIPIAQQLYMRLKSEALQDPSQDLQLSGVLAPNGEQVFTTVTGKFTEQSIPYLFTYDGFYQLFLKQSKELAKDSVNQNWVLGEVAKKEVVDEAVLAQAIQDYYESDYIKNWQNVLDNLKLKPVNSLQDSLTILQYASAPDSPLKLLLQTLKKETALTHVPDNLLTSSPKNLLAGVEKVKNVAENLTSVDPRMQRLLNTAKAADGSMDKTPLPGSKVENYFKPLTALINGTGGTTSFDQTLAVLGQLYGVMIDLSRTSNSGGAALKAAQQHNTGNDAITKTKAESARLPEPFKSMMQTLATSNLRIILGNSKSQLDKLWQTEVMPLYNAGIENRYPFEKKTLKEVSLADFGRFFAKNGVLDKFFTANLLPFVDISGENWQLISEGNQSIGLSEAVLAQFQLVEKIRQIFFAEGSVTPLIKFNLRPVSLDSNATKFWLNIEGQQTEYIRSTPNSKSKPFQWPGTEKGIVSFGFETVDGKKLRSTEDGAWAWFRVLDNVDIQQTVQDSYLITFNLEGLQASYELTANSVDNPFSFSAFKKIHFPKSLY